MSIQSYKILDLSILTIIGCIIEGVMVFAGNQTKFMVEGFSLSLFLVFSLIGMIRWNYMGVIPGIAAALTGIIIQNQFVANAYTFPSILSLLIGVAFTAVLVLGFKFKTKKEIKENILYLVIYTVIAYLLFIVVYSIFWSIIAQIDMLSTFSIIVSRNLLNCVIAIIVMIIASKQRDFLVDQKEYLINLHSLPDSIRVRKEINEDGGESLMQEVVASDEINDIALLDGGRLSEEDLIKLNKNFKEKEGDRYGTRKS